MLILVRPHVSLLDGLVVAAWLPRAGIHRAIFAVDPDYARHSLYGPMLKLYGTITGGHEMLPLDAAHPFSMRKLLRLYGIITGGHEMLPLDAAHPFTMRKLLRLLDAGRDVVIFPQGTGLSIPDRPDMPGCRWLASHTKRRVVKITLDHWDLWPHVTRACLQ